MLNYAKGNLIDMAEAGDFDVIVHGCNCHNVMGSGIAKEIRERYPQAYESDTRFHQWLACDYGGSFIYEKLGSYTECMNGKETFTIINAYTQVNFMPRGVDHFEYDSFALILRKLAVRFPDGNFGFPYIGCGLAGGDKERIVSMLDIFANEIYKTGGTVTLVEFA